MRLHRAVQFSGSVTRIARGQKTRVVRNLVSVGGQDGSFTAGPHGVSVAPDGSLFVAITAAPECSPVGGLPPAARRQLGKLRVKSGPRPVRARADAAQVECPRNVDRTDRTSNPYAVLALDRSRAIVVDAGANALLRSRPRGVSLLAVLPKNRRGDQSVPTSIAVGPNRAYYVGEFVGEPPRRGGPRNGEARVFRVDPRTGRVSVHARGFNTITGIAFDREGSMYVTKFSVDVRNERSTRGDVVKVPRTGPRTRLGGGRLNWPAGAAIGRDGALYVANWSVLPGSTPRSSPFRGASGQVVRLRTR